MNERYIPFVMLLLLFAAVFAHQPKLVMGHNLAVDTPYEVVQPEVSKAYYGELTGQPDYYIIEAREPFHLYVQVNSPLAPNEARKFSVEILNASKERYAIAYENESKWHQWFEPFGGDWYLRGPEYSQDVPAGIYYIKVYNGENRGKYSLAIGEKEEFPPAEMISATLLIPSIKQAFFGKNVLMAFLHLAGVALGIGAISIIFISGPILIRPGKMSPKAVNVYYAARPLMLAGVLLTCATWVLIYLENPENIMGMVKSALLGVLAVLALALMVFVNPKPDRKTGKSNVKMHGPVVLLSFLGWWLLLLLTVAIM